MLLSPTDERLSEGFRRAIRHEARTNCWHWKGRLNKKGIPICHKGGKRVPAVVFAYRTLIEPGVYGAFWVVQYCHNVRCVNPAHARITCREEPTHERPVD